VLNKVSRPNRRCHSSGRAPVSRLQRMRASTAVRVGRQRPFVRRRTLGSRRTHRRCRLRAKPSGRVDIDRRFGPDASADKCSSIQLHMRASSTMARSLIASGEHRFPVTRGLEAWTGAPNRAQRWRPPLTRHQSARPSRRSLRRSSDADYTNRRILSVRSDSQRVSLVTYSRARPARNGRNACIDSGSRLPTNTTEAPRRG